MLAQIMPLLPSRIGTYWEPFAGAAAVAIALAERGGVRRLDLSDTDTMLMRAWRGVQRDPTAVVRYVDAHERRHAAATSPRDYFFSVRDRMFDASHTDARIAADRIYVIAKAFNGLVKPDRWGCSTATFARTHRYRVDTDNLLAVSHLLRRSRCSLWCRDFSAIRPRPGDVVYVDPPYESEHRDYYGSHPESDLLGRLLTAATVWREHGATVILSYRARQEVIERLERAGYSGKLVVSQTNNIGAHASGLDVHEIIAWVAHQPATRRS